MDNEFLHRTRLLLKEEGIHRLQQSWVAVIGLGGVGSYAAEAIARSGVGHMTIIDRDQVEVSNINRQLPALQSTLGRYKAEVIGERLLDINPSLKLDIRVEEYNPATSSSLLNPDLHFVVDAIDSLVAKIHLIVSCIDNRLPIISAMGAANRLDPLQLHIDDIKNTSNCPMARRVRRELRNNGIYQGVPVVYSTELPVKLENNSTKLGSVAYVPGCAGLLMASYVVNHLAGIK